MIATVLTFGALVVTAAALAVAVQARLSGGHQRLTATPGARPDQRTDVTVDELLALRHSQGRPAGRRELSAENEWLYLVALGLATERGELEARIEELAKFIDGPFEERGREVQELRVENAELRRKVDHYIRRSLSAEPTGLFPSRTPRVSAE